MKKFLSEFKEFALRGNVLDMAIGVVIGGAFGKITTSLVNDVIMPLVGMLIGGIDLSQLDIVLKPAVMNGDEVVTAAVTLGILPHHHHRLHSGGAGDLSHDQGHQPLPQEEGRGPRPGGPQGSHQRGAADGDP